jgi:hypothetical protein
VSAGPFGTGVNRPSPDPEGYPGLRQTTFQRLGPDQDHRLARCLLVSPGANLTQDNRADFIVYTPSVRCQCRVALYVPVPTQLVGPGGGTGFDPIVDDFSTNGSGTGYNVQQLWMFTRAHHKSGGAVLSPTRNVEGSKAGALRIPTDGGLWGFEAEFSTVGEEVYGRLIVPQFREDLPATAQSPNLHLDWWVSAAFASTVPLSDDEWREFCGQARIEVLTGVARVMK